jgi:hypothetical protein
VAGNWNPQIVPNHATGAANFLGKITAPRTVSLDGNKQVQQINFDNGNAYTIAPGSGGTLTVGDGTSGSISVLNGSQQISAPLVVNGDTTINISSTGALTLLGSLTTGGKTIIKDGDGALIINGSQNHAAGAALRVTRGIVNLDSNAGTPGSSAGANLNVRIVGNAANAQSAIILRASQNLKELTVAYTDAGRQTFDLASGPNTSEIFTVTVYSSNLDAAKNDLWNAIKNPNAPGAIDRFDGIIDSDLHPNSGVGIAKLSDKIYIRSTRIGDLNLDGQVSISDFIDLASHFNSPGTWQEGDLNYDGQVTISDFIDLASNFNSNYAGETWPISPEDQQALSTFAASVPEPNIVLAILALSTAAMGRRRRR